MSKVSYSGFWVSGSECRVPGSVFRVLRPRFHGPVFASHFSGWKGVVLLMGSGRWEVLSVRSGMGVQWCEAGYGFAPSESGRSRQ